MLILVQLRLSTFHILFVFGADCYNYHHCLLLMRGRKHVYGSVECGPFGDGRLETGQQDCEHSLIHCGMGGRPPSAESERHGPSPGRLPPPLLPSVSLPSSLQTPRANGSGSPKWMRFCTPISTTIASKCLMKTGITK